MEVLTLAFGVVKTTNYPKKHKSLPRPTICQLLLMSSLRGVRKYQNKKAKVKENLGVNMLAFLNDSDL